MNGQLGQIHEELHYVQNRLYRLDSIPAALYRIAGALENRPTFWQRIRLWLSHRRFHRLMSNGRAQKEWSEKTREALAEFDKKAESEKVPKWGSVWQ